MFRSLMWPVPLRLLTKLMSAHTISQQHVLCPPIVLHLITQLLLNKDKNYVTFSLFCYFIFLISI